MLHPADQLAFDRAMVTQPVWNRFNTAADALGPGLKMSCCMPGPAFDALRTMITTEPILNSCLRRCRIGRASPGISIRPRQ